MQLGQHPRRADAQSWAKQVSFGSVSRADMGTGSSLVKGMCMGWVSVGDTDGTENPHGFLHGAPGEQKPVLSQAHAESVGVWGPLGPGGEASVGQEVMWSQ